MIEVRSYGLRETVSAFRRLSSPPVTAAAVRMANEVLVRELKVNVRALASTRQMARSVNSNQYKVDNGIEVKVGGFSGDQLWAAGAQFGSIYRQFPSPRADGYTVIPAIEKRFDPIAEAYAEAFEHILQT
jgi:hypothetical protein